MSLGAFSGHFMGTTPPTTSPIMGTRPTTTPPTWRNCTNPHAVFAQRSQSYTTYVDPFSAFFAVLKKDDTSWSEAFKECFPFLSYFIGDTCHHPDDDPISKVDDDEGKSDVPPQPDQATKELKQQEQPIIAEKWEAIDLARFLEDYLAVGSPKTTEKEQVLATQPALRMVRIKKELPPLQKAMMEDDIQRVKEMIAEMDPKSAAPLDYALKKQDFKLASFLKKHKETTSRPVIYLVGDQIGISKLQEALKLTIPTDQFLKIPISVSSSPTLTKILKREPDTKNKLYSFSLKHPSITDPILALMNSGIPAVEAIKEYAAQLFEYCDGIWLQGNDPHIGLDKYETGGLPARDAFVYQELFEFALLALQQKATYKPMLAVDAGLLRVNIYYGGTIRAHQDQDLKDLITQVNKGLLGSVLPKPAIGWSDHVQAISKVGRGLEVVALSEDGLVEAMQSSTDDRPLMATQFHPEGLGPLPLVPASAKRAFAVLNKTNNKVIAQFVEAVEASWDETCLAHDLSKKLKLS
ncbi:MAG: gamma-glutamyl-gamma-aminobutyrate hydrolase family protein [Candidatus Berkiellales bacterium]